MTDRPDTAPPAHTGSASAFGEHDGPVGGTFRLLWAAALLAGVSALVIALVAAGGAPEPVPVGMLSAGQSVSWAVPILRLVVDLAAIATAGAVMAASVLLPARPPVPTEASGSADASQDGAAVLLDTSGLKACQDAAVTAGVWAVASLLQLVGTAAVILGVPLTELSKYAAQAGGISQVRVLAVSVVLAAVVAVVLSGTRTVETARMVLVMIAITLVGPLLTGHGAIERTAVWPVLATGSVIVHVLAATTWIGGLAGLLRYGRSGAAAVRRFSRIAFGCAVTVGVTGLLTAEIHLGGRQDGWGLITQWVTTGYGALLFAKVAAFGSLVGIGWWHRRRTLPELAAGRPGVFWRLAVVELLLMAATAGLAVALSRTP